MRKKIYVGFFCLVALLMFAGAISIYELKRLGSKAGELIELDMRYTETVEVMLLSLQAENSAVIKMIISADDAPGPDYARNSQIFAASLAEIAAAAQHQREVESIFRANENYQKVVDGYANQALYLDMAWFTDTYLDAYYRLDNAVREYISRPRTALSERTALLESNVYKTISPSILTLIVAILVVLMLLYFIDVYYIKPLRRINKGLKGYLERKIHFDDSFEASDDLEALKTMTAELIQRTKKQ